MEKGVALRVPYRNPRTPPLTPISTFPDAPSTSTHAHAHRTSNRRASESQPVRDTNTLQYDDGYPESPTRGTYRRGDIPSGSSSSSSSGRPLISLNDRDGSPPLNKDSDSDSHSKRISRRFSIGYWRRRGYTKRLLAVLLLLGLVGLLGRGWKPPGGAGLWRGVKRKLVPQAPFRPPPAAIEEEGKSCQFVSVMEAYRRDLHRLRKRVASKRNITLTHLDTHITGQPGDGSTSRHLFSSTGHLLVSEELPLSHPIPLLLQRGDDHWKELVSKQSKDLTAAVTEYERRYGRRPPKGFDIWWAFSQENGLLLPDEYDRINLDLAPFFALPKGEIKKRLKMVEDMKETFTLVIENGEVGIQINDKGGLKWEGTWPRAQDAAALIGTFASILPDMKATFSIFDQPQIYLSWARRGSLVDLGLRGLHTTHLEESDVGHVQLLRSCPPDSNFRMNSTFQEGRSFIYDTIEAGDMCQNPWLIPLHGLTLERHERNSHPRPHTQLLPLFSLAKTSINSDILITPLDQFFDPVGYDPPWEKKKSDRLAWRGSPTGISMMTSLLPWRSSHRIRLHKFANDKSLSPVSYLTPDLGQKDPTQAPQKVTKRKADLDAGLRYGREEVWTRVASHFFFDMKLAGYPIQCSEEDGTCDDLRKEISWAPHQSAQKLNQHKFLLDIDGNGWSGRFRRLMSTNSVVIKTGLFTEWFQPHLIPWFMYIPSKLDFSDLADILAFFRGSPRHPDLGFDETAKAIGSNGKCFVEKMFRLEDMQGYMLRLFLEYARLTADEGIDMDFYHDDGAFAAKNRMKEEGEDEGEHVSPLVKSDVPDRVQQALSAFDARQDLAAAAEATSGVAEGRREGKEVEEMMKAVQHDS